METITTRIVKPSSPTPHRFKNHKLSTLDRLTLSIYLLLIFFYENNESKHDHEEISQRLKHSLSEILTVFYPLAGEIKQNSFVDCDDRGVEFVEARVHARLAQLIQNPNLEKLKQLVPVDTSSSYEDNASQLLVKTSYFDCGGIAVGVCLSHKIADTASFTRFMNAWAATCRGESSRIIHPSFDLALHFPPTDMPPLPNNYIRKGKSAIKRLVFESKKIEKLRQAAAVKKPSRVEAVSAFIWRSFIEANKGKHKSMSSWGAIHAVNLRPRTVPPLPDQIFGNCVGFVFAVVPPTFEAEEEEEDRDLEYYVSKLRVAIRGLDDDYINKVIKDKQYYSLMQNQASDLFNPCQNCYFSSWCRFPVYDVDFGWGKPVWVCTTTTPFMNIIVLMSTPSGDGIEAWVNYDPDDDDFFQLLQHNYNNLLTN